MKNNTGILSYAGRDRHGYVVFALVLLFAFSLQQGDAFSASRRSPVVQAVEKVSPAVVNISTLVQERVRPSFPFSGDDFFRDFFPDFFTKEYTRTSLGSGVIIDGESGYIITNHHVVARATEIKVITTEKDEYKAKIIGSDPRSDLAILQIELDKRLADLKMGQSDDLMIGETVIAIGNPFGLSHTVTTGVVSALDRSVRTDDHIYRHFIQTDASINPGNSGGPLLNIEGDLIGINTAIYQKAQGIGFAIPINKAKRIVKELLRAGEVRFPWLGLEIQELTPQLTAHFGLTKETSGVLVSDVYQRGPAAKVGLKRGDIILDLEGTPISSPGEYRDVLSEYTPSDRLGMTIHRGSKRVKFVVHATSFPQDLVLDMVYDRMGIKVGDIDGSTRRRYSLAGGVLIEKVKRGSEAGQTGLEGGDVILKVNGLAVKDLDTFIKTVSRFHHLPSLTLLVRRGPYGYSLTLPF